VGSVSLTHFPIGRSRYLFRDFLQFSWLMVVRLYCSPYNSFFYIGLAVLNYLVFLLLLVGVTLYSVVLLIDSYFFFHVVALLGSGAFLLGMVWGMV